jgi:hypothetical protein
VQFTDYLDDAMLSLAKFFLAPEVKRFVSSYRKRGFKAKKGGEEERMTDLIVAWELARFEAGKGALTT